MTRYFFRRLINIPIILLLTNFIGFTFGFYVAPIVEARNPYSSADIKLPPFLPSYFDYLQGFLRGNFGETFTGESVRDAIIRFGSASLGLIGIALTLSIILGIALGRLAIRRDKHGVSSWLTIISTVGLASPSFYIAILLITFFLLLLLYGPFDERIIPFQGFGWDAHLILPSLALMIQPTVKIAQVTGGLLSEEMEKQYVMVARSFGYPFKTIKDRLAFRNILAPLFLTISSSLRLMMVELIIIERLFNWPGIGKLIASTLSLVSPTNSFLSPPMMAALLSFLVGIFLLTDLIASFAARAIDPRLRRESDTELKIAGAK